MEAETAECLWGSHNATRSRNCVCSVSAPTVLAHFFTNSKNVFLNFTLFCVRLSQSLTQFAILSRHGGAKMALQDRKFMHQRAAMRMQT